MAQIDWTLQGRGTASEHDGPQPVNVNSTERIVSGMVGGGLLWAALGRRPLTAIVLGLAGGALAHRAVSGHCHLYGALGIDTTRRRRQIGVPAQQGYRVEKTVHIERPPEKVFAAWEKIENLPTIMNHLMSVTNLDDRRSHWVAKGPLGTTVEWDAEVILQREDRLIAWRSLPGSQVDTAGSVHFEPTAVGTRVRVNLKYNPPGGKLGASLASFLGQGLEQKLAEDLDRFKRAMEGGAGSTVWAGGLGSSAVS